MPGAIGKNDVLLVASAFVGADAGVRSMMYEAAPEDGVHDNLISFSSGIAVTLVGGGGGVGVGDAAGVGVGVGAGGTVKLKLSNASPYRSAI